MYINKAVVGSGHRDVPKYVGEGVASCGPPSNLRPFSGNFQIMHFGHTASEAHLLVFGCYVVNEHRDVTYDVMALHMHQSCDLPL